MLLIHFINWSLWKPLNTVYVHVVIHIGVLKNYQFHHNIASSQETNSRIYWYYITGQISLQNNPVCLCHGGTKWYRMLCQPAKLTWYWMWRNPEHIKEIGDISQVHCSPCTAKVSAELQMTKEGCFKLNGFDLLQWDAYICFNSNSYAYPVKVIHEPLRRNSSPGRLKKTEQCW